MLKNVDIVYIGNDWFTENKTSCHHIAETLAQDNRILYIEASGQRAPRLHKRDFKKIIRKIKKLWRLPIIINKNFMVCSPVILPFHKYLIVKKINNFLLKFQIKKWCRLYGFNAPLLWILFPHFSSIIGKLNETGIVYYCVDEYSEMPNVNKEEIKKYEENILKHADIVFAVSDKLYRSKKKFCNNTYLSLHGVDVEHFGKANDEDLEIPDNIKRIKRPIAGFVGLIDERFDLKLIEYLSRKMPDLSLVFVGLTTINASSIEDIDNVFFLGHKPYESLPNYMKAFDVCIIPYDPTDGMVINSNPKKIREYLATGKPVVSVMIDALTPYKNHVYLANDNDDFIHCVSLALQENSSVKSRERIGLMKKESWQYRINQISNKIVKHLPHLDAAQKNVQ